MGHFAEYPDQRNCLCLGDRSRRWPERLGAIPIDFDMDGVVSDNMIDMSASLLDHSFQKRRHGATMEWPAAIPRTRSGCCWSYPLVFFSAGSARAVIETVVTIWGKHVATPYPPTLEMTFMLYAMAP